MYGDDTGLFAGPGNGQRTSSNRFRSVGRSHVLGHVSSHCRVFDVNDDWYWGLQSEDYDHYVCGNGDCELSRSGRVGDVAGERDRDHYEAEQVTPIVTPTYRSLLTTRMSNSEQMLGRRKSWRSDDGGAVLILALMMR